MTRDLYHYMMLYVTYFFSKKILPERPPDLGNILVLAPHPDDEVFGTGGVILFSLEQGKEVNILYLTDGEASGVHPDKDLIRRERQQMTEAVCKTLGIPLSQQHRLHLQDGGVPNSTDNAFESAVSAVASLIDRIKPDSVLATHELDYWPYDHVACAEIARDAVRNSRQRPNLYLYWVWAWYNIRPKQLFTFDREKFFRFSLRQLLERKKNLVNLYLDRKTPAGIPWSGNLPKALRKSFLLDIEILEKRDICEQ